MRGPFPFGVAALLLSRPTGRFLQGCLDRHEDPEKDVHEQSEPMKERRQHEQDSPRPGRNPRLLAQPAAHASQPAVGERAVFDAICTREFPPGNVAARLPAFVTRPGPPPNTSDRSTASSTRSRRPGRPPTATGAAVLVRLRSHRRRPIARLPGRRAALRVHLDPVTGAARRPRPAAAAPHARNHGSVFPVAARRRSAARGAGPPGRRR